MERIQEIAIFILITFIFFLFVVEMAIKFKLAMMILNLSPDVINNVLKLIGGN